jgi:hypothetical protein
VDVWRLQIMRLYCTVGPIPEWGQADLIGAVPEWGKLTIWPRSSFSMMLPEYLTRPVRGPYFGIEPDMKADT